MGPANSQYQLSISGFTGIAPTDPFSTHSFNGMKFTTKDRDNDKRAGNCAVIGDGRNAGGWWFYTCSHIHVNHQYNYKYSIVLNGKWHHLPFIEIKIKPNTCNA